MNRKIAAAIAALCIIAVLGAAGSIAYRVISDGEEGRKAAEADFSGLLSILSAARSASDLGNQELRGQLAAHFSSSPSLLAAEVYKGGATIWRMPADSPYPLGASAADVELPASALRLSAPLGYGAADAPYIDAVYVRVSQLSVFTAFRDALVFLAGFLALASIAAAFASRPRRPRPAYAAATESAAARESAARESAARESAAASAPAPSTIEEEANEEAEEETPRPKAGNRKRPAKTAQREIEELFSVDRDEAGGSLPVGESMGGGPYEAEPVEPAPEPAAAPALKSAFDFERDIEGVEELEDIGERSEPIEPAADDFKPAFFEEPVDEVLFAAPEPSLPGEAEPVEDVDAEADADAEDEEPFDIPRIDFEDELARDRPARAALKPVEDVEELPDIDLEPALGLAESAPAGRADSGLLSGDDMPRALEAQARLALKAGRDLSVLVLAYDDLTPVVPEYERFVEAMRGSLEPSSMIFPRGRSGFAALLPGADSRRALAEAEALFRRLDFLSGGDVGELHLMPLYLGLSSLAGREMDARVLLEEAEAALERSREDPDSHIVAFRPDPARYREFVREKSG